MGSYYKPSAGFSLIEVIITIFLIIAMGLVIANIPQAIRLVTLSQSESLIREVAAKKLEDMRLLGYENIAADGTTNFTDPRLSKLAAVSATSTVVDCAVTGCAGGVDVKEVTILIEWNENNAPKSFEIVTLIGKGGLK